MVDVALFRRRFVWPIKHRWRAVLFMVLCTPGPATRRYCLELFSGRCTWSPTLIMREFMSFIRASSRILYKPTCSEIRTETVLPTMGPRTFLALVISILSVKLSYGIAIYGQCAGLTWTGTGTCDAGLTVCFWKTELCDLQIIDRLSFKVCIPKRLLLTVLGYVAQIGFLI